MPQAPEPEDTTHFSVVDKDGMAVSNTYTLEGGYGSHVVISGTGILLNNEMGDFNKKPGETNLTGDIGTPPNLIAPGKRMLSSMTPTIVARNGKLVLVTGSPGSRTIINTVLDIVLDVTAWHLAGRQAVDAPRMHHQWLPDTLTIEADGVSDKTLEAVKALGHNARMSGHQGSAQTIWMHPLTRHGVRRRGYEGSDGEGEQGGRTVGSAGSAGSTGSAGSGGHAVGAAPRRGSASVRCLPR